MSIRKAELAIKRMAKTGKPFTSDSLHGALGKVREPRHLGALMREAVRAGLIRPTGAWRTSSRRECHSRPVREWVGA